MNALDQGPLSEGELAELDKFLLSAKGVDDSMDVSTLDGFLTAIQCGPKLFLPSQWIRWVWDMERGEASPQFRSQTQAERVFELLLRHMNDIAITLRNTPQHYEPLLLQNPNHGDPIPILDEWCSGFMKGVGLDVAGWQPVVLGKPGWLRTIMLYGTEEGWELLKQKDLPLDEHRALAGGLADSVRNIHAHFLEQRKDEIRGGKHPGVIRREPVRGPEKVGRNSPCPCGSGKKYKICHGISTSLH